MHDDRNCSRLIAGHVDGEGPDVEADAERGPRPSFVAREKLAMFFLGTLHQHLAEVNFHFDAFIEIVLP